MVITIAESSGHQIYVISLTSLVKFNVNNEIQFNLQISKASNQLL